MTRIAHFDRHAFEVPYFDRANRGHGFEIAYFSTQLNSQTAALANGYEVVCIFVNDRADAAALKVLAAGGTRLLALRSAGFNHVDLNAAESLGIKVVRVPEYSPYAVAEHALALLLTLNRKTHRAFHRVRDGNFSLDGLVGFDIHGKTAGIVGAGKIGRIMIRLMQGFGCEVLAYDPKPSAEALATGAKFVDFKTLVSRSDIISLHLPLLPETRYLMNAEVFAAMKTGAVLINTGRGALVDTKALIEVLKSGHLGGAALDVYEEEEGLFFQDHSGEILQDDQLARLLSFPNVILTSHQAFLTAEALEAIASTTLNNVAEWTRGGPLSNAVKRT
jgi:D-lactate dehydrogenase